SFRRKADAQLLVSAASVGRKPSGCAVCVRCTPCATFFRALCRVKSQETKPSPDTDPRKLFALVRSRLKQGCIGRPRSEAQTDSALTCSVLGGKGRVRHVSS